MNQVSKELIQAVSSPTNHLPFPSLSLLICQVAEIQAPAIHADYGKNRMG